MEETYETVGTLLLRNPKNARKNVVQLNTLRHHKADDSQISS